MKPFRSLLSLVATLPSRCVPAQGLPLLTPPTNARPQKYIVFYSLWVVNSSAYNLSSCSQRPSNSLRCGPHSRWKTLIRSKGQPSVLVPERILTDMWKKLQGHWLLLRRRNSFVFWCSSMSASHATKHLSNFFFWWKTCYVRYTIQFHWQRSDGLSLYHVLYRNIQTAVKCVEWIVFSLCSCLRFNFI